MLLKAVAFILLGLILAQSSMRGAPANDNFANRVPSSASPKFVRAVVYVAPNEICNNNLKQIRFAKNLWLRSVVAPGRDLVPDLSDLLPEISTLYCPVAGSGPTAASYIVEDVLDEPICTIVPSHILEEPK